MSDANTFEFWLDVSVAGDPACTVFGRIMMPVRPLAGERISFHQDKGSALEFQVEWPSVGWRRCNSVSVEVDEVSHYAARDGQDLRVGLNIPGGLPCADAVKTTSPDAYDLIAFVEDPDGYRVELIQRR